LSGCQLRQLRIALTNYAPTKGGIKIINMPKLKTYQALSKRLKFTKNKKILIKKSGQNHFNARESGKITMKKRSHKALSKSNIKAVKKLIPKI